MIGVPLNLVWETCVTLQDTRKTYRNNGVLLEQHNHHVPGSFQGLVSVKNTAPNMPIEGLKKPRAKHACRECNSRRIRCNVTERHPCSNCETSQATCEVLPSRRGRYPRRSKKQKQVEEASSATPEPIIAASSAAPPSALTSAVAATLASMSTASPSLGLSSSGASQTPYADTPVSVHSTGATTGGSRFFGESNFITLVPGASETGAEAVVGDGALKGRLTFPVPQTPQTDLATSPASTNHISSATERYLRDEGALTFPDMQNCLPALRAYFKWFHPCFPILDRAEVARRLVTMEISPLLLQAMLFIGSTYCDEATIVAMGFKDRSEAKSMTYSRARVLFHSNWEKDEFTLIQSLFLCSFWRGGPTDWRDVRYWLGAVLTLAQTHGLHRS
ncbi:cutinase transcription factor 1 beta [Colletotrichum spaethianum]|uniref:Cutinase transcription factor 1 beta n=1 Tax=Colletotrichum spaethianum TaxID=700344 RepID=A0AA37URG0_9PEZI|nr:cutinase transcription factor 1 beta [Colletotrichum spaethianum]GKT50672.1 cutinase transcription factor 1 beta [Colletotrichum spaethianum]